MYYTSSPDL